MPETWGNDEHVALLKFRRCGLVAGQRLVEPSGSVESGTVFGTVPPAGTEVARGDSIAYVVAGDLLAVADESVEG